MYNWQQREWANFIYNHLKISEKIANSLESFDEMSRVLEGLNSAEQQNELVDFMILEALKTSEIEGELISRQDLRSSIRNRLGLNVPLENVKDRRAAAVSNMLVTVRDSFSEKLTESAIKQWHKLLFENSKRINAGKWRTGSEPMQIVSGAMGHEIVHYEAPPSYRVPAEMKQFVTWYNSFKISNKNTDSIIKTAISHLYFESIHPFEDGNGRIGRAIVEKCLAQSLGKPVLLSLSTTIEKNKKQYYDCLEKSQSSLDITEWILFFADIIRQAQMEATETVNFSIQKTKYFDRFKKHFNDRQLKTINKMLDSGHEDFEGGMTAKKYMSINSVSKATATRDLQELAQIGALQQAGEGRSVHYQLKIKNN